MDNTKPTVTPQEMKRRLDAGEIEFIFDLRNEEEFEAWRIEGRTPIPSMNIPQTDFVGEEDKFFDRFPKDKEIITICAHGDSSAYSAEILAEQGFRALGLQGGMDAWSELYETHLLDTGPDVYQVYRVARGCISHVVASRGEAAIIDATRHTGHIEKIIAEGGLTVKYVFDTHLQADHISGGLLLAKKYNAPYFLHHLDSKDASYEHLGMDSGKEYKVGGATLRAIHSPGHTPGSVSLVLDDRFLFTGDTIMKTSIGRPDLGGMVTSWSGLLFDTLFTRFKDLPDEIVILPTHAAGISEQDEQGMVRITLGESRRLRNLYQLRDLREFTEMIKKSLLLNPDRYAEIRKVNLGLLSPDEKKQKELEIGKNLCGMTSRK